jgi:hypothetical protein
MQLLGDWMKSDWIQLRGFVVLAVLAVIVLSVMNAVGMDAERPS